MDEQTMTPVIAVLAYRRAPSLNRLLNALDAAHYPDDVQLIISLEGGASPEVVALAKQFRSNKLNVKVLEHDRRLGLREHVLACGNLALEYGSVIVLEDDLLVDPFFYQYASSALQYYDDADLVAGIALYKHERNEYADLAFTPMGNGYSTYLMQLACSWGQCWSKKQWLKFKKWYKGKDHAYLHAIEGLPLAAKNWPESSWKKYFHGFLIETKRFFVYPYDAYSTNCSDEGGEHISNGTIFHQVSMGSPQREFVRPIFVPVSNTEVLYDAYMEPIGDFVWRSLGLDAEEVEVDMQGIKPKKLLNRKQYTLTSKKSNNPIRAYEQSYKPPEMNMMFPVPDSKSMPWILAKSVDVKENKRIIRSVESYSYYVGINLMSRAVIKALLLGLPESLMRKLNSARRTD